jgi:hypothetical protein
MYIVFLKIEIDRKNHPFKVVFVLMSLVAGLGVAPSL